MDLRVLRTFATAAQLGNFTKAAEVLFLAQPTVTIHIQQLERELGHALFIRYRRRVTLTPAGHRFLPHALTVLADVEAGLDDLSSWSQNYRERLTIACAPMIAFAEIPQLLRSYTEKHPAVAISLVTCHSEMIGRVLYANEADLGLARIVPIEAGLETTMLYNDPVILVASGRDPLRYEGTTYTQLLSEQTLFTHNHGGYWESLLLTLRQMGVRFRTMKVSEVQLTKRFVDEGLGLSFLPHRALLNELEDGRLVQVPTPGFTLPVAHTYLVTREAEAMSDAAKAFIETLKATYQQDRAASHPGGRVAQTRQSRRQTPGAQSVRAGTDHESN